MTPSPKTPTDREALIKEIQEWAYILMDQAHAQFGTLGDYPMAKIWIENTIDYLVDTGHLKCSTQEE